MSVARDELPDRASMQIDITTIEARKGIMLSFSFTFPGCLTIELSHGQSVRLEAFTPGRKVFLDGAFPEAGGTISIVASPVLCALEPGSAASTSAHAVHILVDASGLVRVTLPKERPQHPVTLEVTFNRTKLFIKQEGTANDQQLQAERNVEELWQRFGEALAAGNGHSNESAGITMVEANASLLDKTLWRLAQRSTEFVRALSGHTRTHLPPRELVMSQLRSSDLGIALARIIGFAEGADVDQEQVREALEYALRVIFADSLQEEYMLPLHLHKTPLGCAIYAARARLIPPERLMHPGQVAKLLGVKRQNIYEWVEDRTLVAEYPQGKMMFDRLHIEAFQQERQKRLQQRNARGTIPGDEKAAGVIRSASRDVCPCRKNH